MHGKGTFYDPRLNDAAQVPDRRRDGFGNVRSDPDLITSKLAALHFYQLAIPAPTPAGRQLRPGRRRSAGEALFSGKASCATCHVPPLFTEPGWNMHTPPRSASTTSRPTALPDERYRTTPLEGPVDPQKGGFYHDGRFATLLDVVNHYNRFNLGLTDRRRATSWSTCCRFDAPVIDRVKRGRRT